MADTQSTWNQDLARLALFGGAGLTALGTFRDLPTGTFSSPFARRAGNDAFVRGSFGGPGNFGGLGPNIHRAIHPDARKTALAAYESFPSHIKTAVLEALSQSYGRPVTADTLAATIEHPEYFNKFTIISDRFKGIAGPGKKNPTHFVSLAEGMGTKPVAVPVDSLAFSQAISENMLKARFGGGRDYSDLAKNLESIRAQLHRGKQLSGLAVRGGEAPAIIFKSNAAIIEVPIVHKGQVALGAYGSHKAVPRRVVFASDLAEAVGLGGNIKNLNYRSFDEAYSYMVSANVGEFMHLSDQQKIKHAKGWMSKGRSWMVHRETGFYDKRPATLEQGILALKRSEAEAIVVDPIKGTMGTEALGERYFSMFHKKLAEMGVHFDTLSSSAVDKGVIPVPGSSIQNWGLTGMTTNPQLYSTFRPDQITGSINFPGVYEPSVMGTVQAADVARSGERQLGMSIMNIEPEMLKKILSNIGAPELLPAAEEIIAKPGIQSLLPERPESFVIGRKKVDPVMGLLASLEQHPEVFDEAELTSIQLNVQKRSPGLVLAQKDFKLSSALATGEIQYYLSSITEGRFDGNLAFFGTGEGGLGFKDYKSFKKLLKNRIGTLHRYRTPQPLTLRPGMFLGVDPVTGMPIKTGSKGSGLNILQDIVAEPSGDVRVQTTHRSKIGQGSKLFAENAGHKVTIKAIPDFETPQKVMTRASYITNMRAHPWSAATGMTEFEYKNNMFRLARNEANRSLAFGVQGFKDMLGADFDSLLTSTGEIVNSYLGQKAKSELFPGGHLDWRFAQTNVEADLVAGGFSREGEKLLLESGRHPIDTWRVLQKAAADLHITPLLPKSGDTNYQGRINARIAYGGTPSDLGAGQRGSVNEDVIQMLRAQGNEEIATDVLRHTKTNASEFLQYYSIAHTAAKSEVPAGAIPIGDIQSYISAPGSDTPLFAADPIERAKIRDQIRKAASLPEGSPLRIKLSKPRVVPGTQNFISTVELGSEMGEYSGRVGAQIIDKVGNLRATLREIDQATLSLLRADLGGVDVRASEEAGKFADTLAGSLMGEHGALRHVGLGKNEFAVQLQLQSAQGIEDSLEWLKSQPGQTPATERLTSKSATGWMTAQKARNAFDFSDKEFEAFKKGGTGEQVGRISPEGYMPEVGLRQPVVGLGRVQPGRTAALEPLINEMSIRKGIKKRVYKNQFFSDKEYYISEFFAPPRGGDYDADQVTIISLKDEAAQRKALAIARTEQDYLQALRSIHKGKLSDFQGNIDDLITQFRPQVKNLSTAGEAQFRFNLLQNQLKGFLKEKVESEIDSSGAREAFTKGSAAEKQKIYESVVAKEMEKGEVGRISNAVKYVRTGMAGEVGQSLKQTQAAYLLSEKLVERVIKAKKMAGGVEESRNLADRIIHSLNELPTSGGKPLDTHIANLQEDIRSFFKFAGPEDADASKRAARATEEMLTALPDMMKSFHRFVGSPTHRAVLAGQTGKADAESLYRLVKALSDPAADTQARHLLEQFLPEQFVTKTGPLKKFGASVGEGFARAAQAFTKNRTPLLVGASIGLGLAFLSNSPGKLKVEEAGGQALQSHQGAPSTPYPDFSNKLMVSENQPTMMGKIKAQVPRGMDPNSIGRQIGQFSNSNVSVNVRDQKSRVTEESMLDLLERGY